MGCQTVREIVLGERFLGRKDRLKFRLCHLLGSSIKDVRKKTHFPCPAVCRCPHLTWNTALWYDSVIAGALEIRSSSGHFTSNPGWLIIMWVMLLETSP